MKSIILGHSSMLGKALMQKFANSNLAYITAGRTNDSSIYIDLSSQPPNDSLLVNLGDIDCIFVLPSSFEDDSTRGTTQNILINTAGCSHTISLAEATKAKTIIYAGSVFSYKDFDTSRGMSSYGLSKAFAEELLGWWANRHGVRFTSIRFSQLYDDHGLCIRHQPWIGRIIRYGFEKEDLHIPASEGKRNFLHVADAAELLLAASSDLSLRGILNGSSPSNFSYQDIAETVFRLNDCIDRLHVSNTKEPFRPVRIPTDTLLYTMLDRTPNISVENWVERISSLQTWRQFGPMDVKYS